jgi:nitrite reductase/ring-hydroxylating ferredoxin subunit
VTPDRTTDCRECALCERREFLRDAVLWTVGALTALGIGPARAAALPVRFARAARLGDDEISYPLPDADGATIDRDNQVILVRFEGKAYAFALSCPHQNTALRWHPEDGQFQCPKHHSRYRPDGVFISGRATRSMDRFALRRDGQKVVVDLDKLYRQDRDATDWAAAVIAL